MEEENKDVSDISQTEETTDLETVTEEVDSTQETTDVETESTEDLKARLAKAEELANNQKIRAEKAERKAKETHEKPKEESSALTSRDTIALINAKVHEDDVDEVLEWARFKKIPVAEALKSPILKASLSERQELRQTANATNTGKARSGAARASGESLLERARKTGEMPDSDEALEALVAARTKK